MHPCISMGNQLKQKKSCTLKYCRGFLNLSTHLLHSLVGRLLHQFTESSKCLLVVQVVYCHADIYLLSFAQMKVKCRSSIFCIRYVLKGELGKPTAHNFFGK